MSMLTVVPDPVGKGTMTAPEAKECCSLIRGHIDQARELILELHDRKGWRALGYESWGECVAKEFSGCRDTLYKQLDAARVAKEMSGVENFDTREIPDSHLRALKALSNEQRVEVYKEARASAGGRPTAAIVRAKVKQKRKAQGGVAREPEAPVTPVAATPFSDSAEIRTAFEAVLEQQAATRRAVHLERMGIRKRGLKRAAEKAQEALRDVLAAFERRLPPATLTSDSSARRSQRVIIKDGVCYTSYNGSASGWTEADLLNLDATD